MKHEKYMTTQEMIIELLIRILELAAGRIPLNICKVLAVANAAGFIFSILCVDSDCYVRVLACMAMFGVLAAFFGSVAWMIEDMNEEYEEDEL